MLRRLSCEGAPAGFRHLIQAGAALGKVGHDQEVLSPRGKAPDAHRGHRGQAGQRLGAETSGDAPGRLPLEHPHRAARRRVGHRQVQVLGQVLRPVQQAEGGALRGKVLDALEELPGYPPEGLAGEPAEGGGRRVGGPERAVDPPKHVGAGRGDDHQQLPVGVRYRVGAHRAVRVGDLLAELEAGGGPRVPPHVNVDRPERERGARRLLLRVDDDQELPHRQPPSDAGVLDLRKEQCDGSLGGNVLYLYERIGLRV